MLILILIHLKITAGIAPWILNLLNYSLMTMILMSIIKNYLNSDIASDNEN